MKALVIYESMYGNTAAVASAIADGVARERCGGSRQTRHRGPAGPGGEAGLLVVGGPTHAHGMSRPSSRKTAAADKENVFLQPTVTPGLSDWIAELPGGNGRSPRRGGGHRAARWLTDYGRRGISGRTRISVEK